MRRRGGSRRAMVMTSPSAKLHAPVNDADARPFPSLFHVTDQDRIDQFLAGCDGAAQSLHAHLVTIVTVVLACSSSTNGSKTSLGRPITSSACWKSPTSRTRRGLRRRRHLKHSCLPVLSIGRSGTGSSGSSVDFIPSSSRDGEGLLDVESDTTSNIFADPQLHSLRHQHHWLHGRRDGLARLGRTVRQSVSLAMGPRGRH